MTFETTAIAIGEDGRPVKPQPGSHQRDRDGHFAGCGYHGCAVTRCRETPYAPDRTWRWTLVPGIKKP
jgi:hypothetical protein